MLFLVLSTVACFVGAARDGYASCSTIKPWPVDDSFSGERFQKLLVARQNDCARYKPWNIVVSSVGVGATMAHVVRMMGEAFSMNWSFRPIDRVPYLWADENPANCSTPQRAVDCYHVPLSYCGFSNSVKGRHEDIIANWSGTDFCQLGQLTGRSLQWMNEQMHFYALRQRDDIQLKILENVEPLFRLISSSQFPEPGRTAGSLSIQLRTGNGDVLDEGRAFEPSLDTYMKYVDDIADRMLKRENKILTVVYLASNNPEKTYISAEHMSRTYPRTFRYYELPHIHIGVGDPMRAHQANVAGAAHKYTNYDLHVEFYTDMHIYSHTDYFIGSTSNVQRSASMLRSVYGRANHTSCRISFTEQANPMMCDDDRATFEPPFHALFGYEGGTMFA